MTNKKSTPNNSAKPAINTPGEFAYDGLDRVIHEKARLGILTSLMNWPDGLVFGDLRSLCALTDGNLNRHLRVLQDAEFIEIWKGQRDNYPQTLIRLTKVGRSRFLEYLQELERVISQSMPSKAVASKGQSSLGWRNVQYKPG